MTVRTNALFSCYVVLVANIDNFESSNGRNTVKKMDKIVDEFVKNPQLIEEEVRILRSFIRQNFKGTMKTWANMHPRNDMRMQLAAHVTIRMWAALSQCRRTFTQKQPLLATMLKIQGREWKWIVENTY